MKKHTTKIHTDGGPWAEHDRCCPVYADKNAVLDIGTGIFSPSWEARNEGYILIRVKNRFIRFFLLKWFGI